MTNDSSHSRRWLWLSIAALVLPALALWLVHAWLGWEGERLWSQAQARLKTEGETLDFMAIVPKPLPDKDNFFAIEPLKDMALVIDGDETKGEPGARRARIKKLELREDNGNVAAPEGSAVDHGVKWDAQEWADYYRASERLTMSDASGNPGRDILAALAPGDGLYAELHAALGRSKSVVTPVYSERGITERMISMPLPNMGSCQIFARLLLLRASAGAACGERRQAVNDVRAMLRFAEGIGHEATLINVLVALTIARMDLDPCWLLLESGCLSSEELMLLSQDLARLDFAQMTMIALQGEAVFVVDTADLLAENSDQLSLLKINSGKPSFREASNRLLSMALWHLNAQAVAQGNKGNTIQCLLDYQIMPLRNSGLNGLVRKGLQFEVDLNAGKIGDGVFDMLTKVTLPDFCGINERALQTQARLHQARLACALEVYFLQHQRYPDTLNELVPAFIDQVLLDPCDDKPMRYSRTPAGRYKLWSLGFDGDDDGGKVIASPKDDPSSPRLIASDYPGDWVWSYERLVPEVNAEE